MGQQRDPRGLSRKSGHGEKQKKKEFGREIFDNLPHGIIGLRTGDK